MAKAVIGGHTSRALDFLNVGNKYFILAEGKESWDTAGNIEDPDSSSYKLEGKILGLKRVDEISMVVPVSKEEYDQSQGHISHGASEQAYWRKVSKDVKSKVLSVNSDSNDIILTLDNVDDFKVGSKILIIGSYNGVIGEEGVSLDTNSNTITLPKNTNTSSIKVGEIVYGGIRAEGAHHVYVKCSLEGDKFPLGTYRQIGLCTDVIYPEDLSQDDSNILVPDVDLISIGVLEILDNRKAASRDKDTSETLAFIVEF